MSAPEYERGECIILSEDGGNSNMNLDDFYVMGHVSPKEFYAAVRPEVAEAEEDQELEPGSVQYGNLRYLFAWWEHPDGGPDDDEDCEYWDFHTRRTPASFTFPVTHAPNLDIGEERRRRRELRNLVADMTLWKFPGCKVEYVQLGERVSVHASLPTDSATQFEFSPFEGQSIVRLNAHHKEAFETYRDLRRRGYYSRLEEGINDDDE